MELKDIGEALSIENRTMRYIMEQGIVPGLDKVNKGRGTRRALTTHQARQVGLAAILHELGYRGPIMQTLLKEGKKQLNGRRQVLEIKVTKRGLPSLTTVYIDATMLLENIK